jgi:hypothetical protein
VRRDLSEEQWRAIEKVLPSHIDRVRLRSELERVLHRRVGLPPEQQRLLRKLERVLERGSALLGPGGLEQKKACADALRRPRLFSLQCGILWAYESAGGDCGISTPRKPKDEAHWPEPTGNIIVFFETTSKAILGKSPGPDRIKHIVSLYRHLNFSAATFAGTGGLRVMAEVLRKA